MQLASVLIDGRESWGLIEGETFCDVGTVLAGSVPDLKSAVAQSAWSEIRAAQAAARRVPLAELRFLPVIPNPDKILCVGLNYESHRRETGREPVGDPVMFLRLNQSQIGHRENILRPRVSEALDYEGELALVIGKPGRYIREADAMSHIAGYSCYNDASVRDWQRHTHQYTPGKNFPATGAFGPWLVTADTIADVEALRLTTRLDGVVVQEAGLDQLIFSIPRIIAYCSAFTQLLPGDVIATGTPGGVGFKREPPLYMRPGSTVEVEITQVGTLVNTIADEAVPEV
jgi:2-keto-4-pentenoate hydratase/2-oxohepta-3-ene-1,7-dioic acid hydratase in catechol pathway